MTTKDKNYEYVKISLLVAVLTPLLYLLMRHFVFGYGLVWVYILAVGVGLKKHSTFRIFQSGLFVSLLISLLAGMASLS